MYMFTCVFICANVYTHAIEHVWRSEDYLQHQSLWVRLCWWLTLLLFSTAHARLTGLRACGHTFYFHLPSCHRSPGTKDAHGHIWHYGVREIQIPTLIRAWQVFYMHSHLPGPMDGDFFKKLILSKSNHLLNFFVELRYLVKLVSLALKYFTSKLLNLTYNYLMSFIYSNLSQLCFLCCLTPKMPFSLDHID